MGKEGQIIVESEVDSSILDGATPAEDVVVDAPAAETPAAEVKEAAEIAEKAEVIAPAGEPAEKSVPKERMDTLINENTELKTRIDLIEQNNALVAANAPATQPLEEFDIYKEAGVSDEGSDSISVEQHRKTLDYVQKTHQAQITDLRFHVMNPDFTEMVGTNDQIAKQEFAPPLAAALKANPALLDQIKSNANPKQAALGIARAAAGAVKAAETTDGEDVIDEAVRNAERVKSGQTVRGGSGVGAQHRFMSMTDEAFTALARKNGANV